MDPWRVLVKSTELFDLVFDSFQLTIMSDHEVGWLCTPFSSLVDVGASWDGSGPLLWPFIFISITQPFTQSRVEFAGVAALFLADVLGGLKPIEVKRQT